MELLKHYNMTGHTFGEKKWKLNLKKDIAAEQTWKIKEKPDQPAQTCWSWWK
jgi:hypothetical protein